MQSATCWSTLSMAVTKPRTLASSASRVYPFTDEGDTQSEIGHQCGGSVAKLVNYFFRGAGVRHHVSDDKALLMANGCSGRVAEAFGLEMGADQ